MFKPSSKTGLRRFARDTDGYVSVEAMIVLPALFLLFAASWVYFDVFRQQAVNQKANYAIGDMISRETEALDDAYIDNAWRLLGLLTKTEVDPNVDIHNSDMRITVVKYNANSDSYQVVWSAARGDYSGLNNGDMNDYKDRLPTMANNGQTVIVETWEDYNPAFRVGLDAFEIKSYSFTHPRYAPQVLWNDDGENNGWGNGDQSAPGNSECNNNAENATDCSNEDGEQNVEPKKGKRR